MHATIHGERTLTKLDYARLSRLPGGELQPALAGLLEVAEVVVPRDIPVDVITMYSQVEIVNLHTRQQQILTVCYPADAEPGTGFISALSPVGVSLLGLKVGAIARWPTPSGEEGAAEVAAILFQPEASGDYLI